jgi:hypothetical protein
MEPEKEQIIYLIKKNIYATWNVQTKNKVAGRHVQGSEKDGGERMERQSKESRNLEAHRKGGQGPTRAVAPSKKKKIVMLCSY